MEFGRAEWVWRGERGLAPPYAALCSADPRWLPRFRAGGTKEAARQRGAGFDPEGNWHRRGRRTARSARLHRARGVAGPAGRTAAVAPLQAECLGIAGFGFQSAFHQAPDGLRAAGFRVGLAGDPRVDARESVRRQPKAQLSRTDPGTPARFTRTGYCVNHEYQIREKAGRSKAGTRAPALTSNRWSKHHAQG